MPQEATVPERKGRAVQSPKTNVEIPRDVSDRIDDLVGRCGKTKGDVVAAGIERLERELRASA